MKVEKINDNRVKITLSFEELTTRNISIDDLEEDSDKARNLFLDLISESDLESSFIFEHSQLYIEASSDNNNSFVVTITKLEDFTDLSKYDVLDITTINKLKSNIIKNVYSNIYVFNNLNTLYLCCKAIKINNYFTGSSKLYINNNMYYLVFNNISVKNINFSKTHNVLCEYSSVESQSTLLETLIKEKYTLLCSKNTLDCITKLEL